MAVATISPQPVSHTERPRALITRQMVHAVLDATIPFDGPFELIQGEILYKIPKKQPHVFVTVQAAEWLRGVFGGQHVQEEKPIVLNNTNEPEPDVAVLTNDRRHYLTAGTPPASDVRLVVEVADTTLNFDLTVKAGLYAESDIPEYWVIDVTGRQVHVLRQPSNGQYTDTILLTDTDTITPLAAPGATTLVATFLP